MFATMHSTTARGRARLLATVLFAFLGSAATARDADIQIGGKAVTVTFESVELRNGEVTGTLELAYAPGSVERHPVILMLGSLKEGELPPWSTGLVAEGYMLAAFKFFHPPDPDPARRSVWLAFDEGFAHGYALNDRWCRAMPRRRSISGVARRM